jgi:hypothetical protein
LNCGGATREESARGNKVENLLPPEHYITFYIPAEQQFSFPAAAFFQFTLCAAPPGQSWTCEIFFHLIEVTGEASQVLSVGWQKRKMTTDFFIPMRVFMFFFSF